MQMIEQTVQHPISPVFNTDSKILILGSFPSVKSREQGFFYGHPQNRFWKVLSVALKENLPQTVQEKREFLLRDGIAVWDVIASCQITGSADSSIHQVIPNDLSRIFSVADIRAVFVNGKTAEKYFKKYQELQMGRKAICLPSTSPANAAYSFEELLKEWEKILPFLKEEKI